MRPESHEFHVKNAPLPFVPACRDGEFHLLRPESHEFHVENAPLPFVPVCRDGELVPYRGTEFFLSDVPQKNQGGR